MSLSFKTAFRAAAVALALGATGLVAAPAQAQSHSPNFNFSFQTPDGFGFSIGEGQRGRGGWGHGPHRPDYRECMSQRDVIRLVRDYGYRDVRPFANDGRYVRVRAEQGRRDYVVTVDSCRGRIVDQTRIRR